MWAASRALDHTRATATHVLRPSVRVVRACFQTTMDWTRRAGSQLVHDVHVDLWRRISELRELTGQLLINGEEKSISSIAHKVGFVPQDDIMFDELSVYDNVYYPASNT